MTGSLLLAIGLLIGFSGEVNADGEGRACRDREGRARAVVRADATSASLPGAYVRVEFDAKGCVSSIREKATGRELVGEKVPFVSVRLKDGSEIAPVSCTADGTNGLLFDFPRGLGSCRLTVTPFSGGWTFETSACDITNAEVLTLGRLIPSCNREKGSLSNIVMDDLSGVVLRGYVPEIDMDESGRESAIAPLDRETWVRVRREHGFVGMRYGLAAGPADKLLEMLSAMAETAGMTQTGCGGPKSLSSDVNRGAYLFATWMDLESADDWIRLMDKAGCQMLHLHAWWLHRGSYEVNPLCFPNGLADMKKLVDRLHAAGKRVSTHSLSAVVQFGDPHIVPAWFDDLATDASYALARPYRRGDTELWVTTRPVAVHDKILNGRTNGNVLRLGDDLLQYDDFTLEPPYRFTGVHIAREPYGDKQTYDPTQAVAEFASADPHGRDALVASARDGRMRTRQARPSQRTLSRAEYPVGARVDYLHHRYAEFVPKPKSRLAEELTDRLAEVFNTLGLDGIYFDGSEAMGSRYAIDWMRERTLAKLRPRNGTVVNSASCRNPFNWWNRSLAGTWDHPTFAPRAFNDRHIRVYRDYCRADFLRTDLGWWNTHAGSAKSRGYFPEEQDYVGCKTAANDLTISLMGPRPTDGPLEFAADQQLTIFGKWERARYARAFRPDLLERMRTPGEDWRLRQDVSGAWTAVPLEVAHHRIASGDSAAWKVALRHTGSASLRVEALYAVDRSAKGVRVLDASHLPSLVRTSNDGVTLSVREGRACRDRTTILLEATNVSAAPNAAWAGVVRTFPEKEPASFDAVSSLWVKGDGSGATLNVQMRGASCSENYVKLDFTGWRKFDLFLRERDADLSENFVWPYESPRRLNNPSLFQGAMDGRKIRSVGYYLNGIPRGKSVSVEVGVWEAFPQKRDVLKNAAVVLNGARLAVPFALTGGEFAELADGGWTHFTETGEPLERLETAETPNLISGTNDIRYEGTNADGAFGRAEVTLFREGTGEGRACRDRSGRVCTDATSASLPHPWGEPAFVKLSAEQKKLLRVEYEMPVMMRPSKGLPGTVDVHVRPGERAAVRFEILGPVVNPAVDGRRMAVTLRDSYDRVASYDGRTWQAIRITPGKCGPDNRTVAAKRTILAEGVFETPLPILNGGTTRLTVTADKAEGARLTFFKEY